MTNDRWAEIERLFHDALGVDERMRSQWLRARCDNDAELFREVNSLLAYDQPAEEQIRHAIESAADHIEEPLELRIGDYVGPYHLIKEIGRGGMGVVYLAARTDPQFFQTVAIKVLKREYGASQLAARFLRERQILATLSHPNIAAVLDGGSTENGIPYLVMEFISGKPLTVYARDSKLGVRAKVRLFQKICAAVHHAHRNLVIHRDLKPANVLVSNDGEPKLLDFGIAKLLGPELLPMELPPTETQWRLMTPAYASPEQLRGEALTTATDVFSLGVILYELLTGAKPFPFTSRDPLEWINTICAGAPPLPSSAPALSARERREIAGDLDQIVLKALRAEPEKRYSSALQLSDDLERFLNEEPVAAQKRTLFYETEKLLHRHRWAFATLVLLILSLAIGVIGMSREAARAQRRFNELRSLAHAVVFDLDDRIRLLPGSTDARGALIRTSLKYLDNLAREADDDPELMAELSRAYRKIGDVQGSPFQPNLGDTKAAERSYRQALALSAMAAEALPRNLDAQIDWVDSQFLLGRILVHSGGLEEGQKLYAAGRERAEELAREHAFDPRVTELRSRGAMYLGDAYSLANDTAKALESYRFAARVLESADATEEGTMREIARAYARIADATAASGHLRQAILFYDRSIDIRQTLARRSPENDDYRRDLFNAYISVGALYGATRPLSLHQPDDAKPWFEKANVIARDLAKKDPGSARTRVDVAFSSAHLADVMQHRDPLGALALYRESIAIFDELVAADPTNVSFRQWQARRYEGIARVFENRKQIAEALPPMERALQIRQQLLADDPARADLNRELASASCGVLRLRTQAGKASQRDSSLHDALSVAKQYASALEPESRLLASAYELAYCYEAFAAEAALRDAAEARNWLAKSRETWERWRTLEPANHFAAERIASIDRRLLSLRPGS